MKKNYDKNLTYMRILRAVCFGCLAALMITIGSVAVLAWLVSDEILKEVAIGYGVAATVVLSVLFGCVIASSMAGQGRLLVSMSTGAMYMLVMMGITALFFGGQYSGIGQTALLVMCAALCWWLLKFKGKKSINYSKQKRYNR